MKVSNGKIVKVEYDLFLNGYNEELAYSTKNEEDGSGCIEFVCGNGELLEPMEAKLVGMEPGQEFKFMIPKDEAYGMNCSSVSRNLNSSTSRERKICPRKATSYLWKTKTA